MQVKEIEFKMSRSSDQKYQLEPGELNPELASKEKKWKANNNLEVVVASSIIN